MKSRRTILVAAVVALVAVVLFLVLDPFSSGQNAYEDSGYSSHQATQDPGGSDSVGPSPNAASVPEVDSDTASDNSTQDNSEPANPDDDTVQVAASVEMFIEGQVVTEDGLSISGAAVDVFPYQSTRFTSEALNLFQRLYDDTPPVGSATAAPNGYFKIPIDEPGRYLVRAAAVDRIIGSEGPVQLNRREPNAFLVLTLPPGVSISGTVRNAAGHVLPGVSVALVQKQQSGRRAFHTYRTETAGDGTFEFQGLDPRTYLLMAKADGFPGKMMPQVDAPSSGLEVRLDGPQEFLGTVLDAETKEPIQGALITGLNPVSYDQTQSDVDGNFALAVSGHDMDVMIKHPEYVIQQQRVSLRQQADAAMEFLVQPGQELRGRVVLNDGSPVPNALVGVLQDAWLNGDIRTTTADAEGFYYLPSVQFGGQAILLAKVPGWVPALATVGAPNAPGSDAGGQDIVLSPAAELAGTILGRNGRPVSGAWLRLHPSGSSQLINAVMWMRGDLETWTESDGSFRFPDLIPHIQYQLEIRHDSYPDTWRPLAGIPSTPLQLELAAGAQLELILETPGRVPPQGAVILAQWPGGSQVRRRGNGSLEGGSRFLAGSDGVAVLHNLPAGQVTLYVIAAGYLEERLQIQLEASDQATRAVSLREGSQVVVRVQTNSGDPVPAARLTLLQMGSGGVRYQRNSRTGNDGTFTFGSVPTGQFQLTVTSEMGNRTVREEVRAGNQEIIVELE